MDKTIIRSLIGLTILSLSAVVMMLLVMSRQQSAEQPVLGSVAQSNEYQATTTDSGLTAGVYYIKTSSGVLGSVVLTSTTVGTFTIHDANGTATTTGIDFEGGATEGTYTFDQVMTKGIAIEVSAPFDGEFVTTYR